MAQVGISSPDFWSGWVDVHSHFADERLDGKRDQALAAAKAAGLTGFLQAGVGPKDWRRQLEIQEQHPEIQVVFGLHPYEVHNAFETKDELGCEYALDELARLIKHSPMLGETGLDLRPKYASSVGLQTEYFENQLELAEVAQKPVVLHLVRAFDEVHRIFDVHGPPKFGGFVHAFAGKPKEAEYFISQGLSVSVGAPVLNPRNDKLQEAVKRIDISKLLIESDAPDQPAFDAPEGTLNSSLVILRVAAEIGRLRGMTAAEVLDISKQNLRRMLS